MDSNRMLARRTEAPLLGATLLALLASTWQVAAANAAPARQARESAPAAAAACGACHGTAGEGNSATGSPRLAGLPAAYQMEQLAAFADGTRQSAVMKPLVRALGLHDRAQLADYYAALAPKAPQRLRPARGSMIASRSADAGPRIFLPVSNATETMAAGSVRHFRRSPHSPLPISPPSCARGRRARDAAIRSV